MIRCSKHHICAAYTRKKNTCVNKIANNESGHVLPDVVKKKELSVCGQFLRVKFSDNENSNEINNDRDRVRDSDKTVSSALPFNFVLIDARYTRDGGLHKYSRLRVTQHCSKLLGIAYCKFNVFDVMRCMPCIHGKSKMQRHHALVCGMHKTAIPLFAGKRLE